MLQGWLILLISFAYLGILFAIAYYGDKRADAGRSIVGNPYIYALSLAVYATTWTFYGSVGRATSTGIGFLPIYLGPTLMVALGWFVLQKIIRISKAQRITSIADFVASRYGKSSVLGGLVTIIAVVGTIPYIALQLKAVSTSFTLLWHYPATIMPADLGSLPILRDTALYVALLMAAFAILFGTRHLDVTEHHEGLVVAIAFESLIKLVAFLAVGVFVTFGLYNGFGDLFARAASNEQLRVLFTMGEADGVYPSWSGLIILSMMAIIFLPRQFQMAVIENVDEQHLHKAIWLFPLYLLVINIFVLPIAMAGLLHFPGGVDPDTFVLTLPMSAGQQGLALFVFLGGLSAATSMVIVESVALSTMVSNNLAMPIMLRLRFLRVTERKDVGRLLLAIRRGAILVILLLSYTYFHLAVEATTLVSIGLVSFAAVAQFAPAILGGIYWKGGNRTGALLGLGAGFLVWLYTLLLPSFAESGWLSAQFLEAGPFGLAFLKPYQLFGLDDFDPITHALFWSMLVNVAGYVGGSLVTGQSALEHSQATRFVDIFDHPTEGDGLRLWRGVASVPDLRSLLGRFLGPERVEEALADYAQRRGLSPAKLPQMDARFVDFAEQLLAGVVGAAAARVMVASVVKEEPLSIEEVMEMLNETSQVIAYSRQLEQQSRELAAATGELREANERLQELDRLKDDFVSMVSHELRTPLTSIRAFAEILFDNPDLPVERRSHFLGIIMKESERLTRLINQILDLAKIEAGQVEWQLAQINLKEVTEEALGATSQLFREKDTRLEVDIPQYVPPIIADRDRLMQVLLNLVSNAVKFSDSRAGWVRVRLRIQGSGVQVDVSDNGPGISLEDQAVIFEKFRQVGDTLTGKPQGTGLGLPISRHIISRFGGELWVESSPGRGATFSFTLPCAATDGEQPALVAPMAEARD